MLQKSLLFNLSVHGYTFSSIIPEKSWPKIYLGQDPEPEPDPDPVKNRPDPQHWFEDSVATFEFTLVVLE
jgi:hypothetical protein